MRALLYAIAFGTAVFLTNIAATFADGVLLVRPPEEQRMTPLGVEYHRVEVSILDGTAVTRIDQVFRNEYASDLEASYLFPIPDDAAITEFALYVNGHKLGGEILERDRARKVYEQIVREMKDPGLLEYVGRNLFRARVYPVPAEGKARIELEYTETLDYDAGLFRYRYPLDTERFSPTPLDEVTISAEIRSSIPIKSVYSPSHDVDVLITEAGASVGYEEKGVKPDRDFQLFYTVSERDLGVNLLAFRKGSEPGYFLLMASPGSLEATTQRKNVVFVLDTSGSMKGAKIRQAQAALRFCIERLHEGDRFGIVQFATGERVFGEGIMPAGREQVASAHEFIDRLLPRGGTNIHDALITTLGLFPPPGGDETAGISMIVFLTDGEPTVGITELGDIARSVQKVNKSGVRLFVFGVGDEVNTHLLDTLARDNRGVSEYVRPGEDLEAQVSAFFRKVSEPVLSDVELACGHIEVSDLVPAVLPDIFSGTQLLVLGRYEDSGSTAITLRGTVGGRQVSLIHEGTFPSEDLSQDFIPRLWATRKIGLLLNEIRLNGEDDELVEEIVRLSTEYGIMTPYTSYLVLERDEEYRAYGLEPTAALRAGGTAFKKAMEQETGEAAVEASMDISSLGESRTARRPVLETVKWVGHKTFYLRNGAWVDSAYREGMRVQELEYLSGKYFDLLAKRPELGPYFALGRNLTVVIGSTCYRIVSE
jgi:Ca-activated chloride channel family protein